MTYTLETISEIMRSEAILSPQTIGEMRRWLAGNYCYIAGLLEEVLLRKTDSWLVIRKNTQSDTRAEKEWSATAEGKQELIYRSQLKRSEKLMSALKTLYEIKEREAMNIF